MAEGAGRDVYAARLKAATAGVRRRKGGTLHDKQYPGKLSDAQQVSTERLSQWG